MPARRRLPRSSILLCVAAVAIAGACVSSAPVIDLPNLGGLDAGSRYADSVISLFVGGQLLDCSASLPDCDAGVPQTGVCGGNPALGPPDGRLLSLGAGDSVALGFTCTGYVTAHADAGDLAVYGTLGDGGAAYAVVEVSDDGNAFEPLGILDGGSPQTFSLSTVPTDRARYVRLTGAGAGVAIDAVQAL